MGWEYGMGRGWEARGDSGRWDSPHSTGETETAAGRGDTYPRDLGTSPSPKFFPRLWGGGGWISPPESTGGHRWESYGSHRCLERGEKEGNKDKKGGRHGSSWKSTTAGMFMASNRNGPREGEGGGRGGQHVTLM